MKVPTSQKEDAEAEHARFLQYLQDIEKNSSDDKARAAAARMRADFSSLETLATLKHLSKWEHEKRRWWNRIPPMRYHDRILWHWVTVIPCVVLAILAATNVSWVLAGDTPLSSLKYAAVFGAASLACYYLSTLRRFSLSLTSESISSKAIGYRYAHLKAGTIPIDSLREVRERPSDQVLEIYDTSGMAMEVPMQVGGYKELYATLSGLAEKFRRM